MTPEQLRAMGEMLYGRDWITPLANALDINVRNVERWSSGARPIPDSILPKFAKLCRTKSHDLADYAAWLERFTDLVTASAADRVANKKD